MRLHRVPIFTVKIDQGAPLCQMRTHLVAFSGFLHRVSNFIVKFDQGASACQPGFTLSLRRCYLFFTPAHLRAFLLYQLSFGLSSSFLLFSRNFFSESRFETSFQTFRADSLSSRAACLVYRSSFPLSTVFFAAGESFLFLRAALTERLS